MSLWTTSIIERLNKEFKPRTKPIGTVAGEQSVDLILAFVAMKMEVSWRKTPFQNANSRRLKTLSGYSTQSS